MKIYLQDNVYEAALKRIERVFNEFDNVVISVSGGKDSTAVMELSLEVARKLNRLPLKVMFIDQEDEWSYTIDYIRYVKSRPEIEFYWFQVPVLETSSANHEDKYLNSWDPAKKDVWMREKEPDAFWTEDIPAIHKYEDEFKGVLVEGCNLIFNYERWANIGGLRADESLNRFAALTASTCYKDITWGKRNNKECVTFYPLYDWKTDDIWTYIAKNHIKYNHVYDLFFNYGVNRNYMRVSSLHHETAYRSMLMLQEIDRKTYDKMCRRLPGVSTFSQLQDQVLVKELPEMFTDWKEYRDYLLEKLIRPDLQHIFVKRWQGQDGEDWYREHVTEVLVNDTVGTKNSNFKSTKDLKDKVRRGVYVAKYGGGQTSDQAGSNQ